MAKIKMRSSKGKVYQGSKPKKVKGGTGEKSLKKALDKWDKKYGFK